MSAGTGPYKPTPAVAEALAHVRGLGFTGIPVSSQSLGDDRHELHMVEVRFECGDTGLYVVAADRHAGGGRPTMIALGDAVHLLQNATEDERWGIGGREPT